MTTDKTGWADRPAIRRRIRWGIYGACILLVIADFIVARHVSTTAEEIPAFYALYGFIALVGVVLAAKALRLLVRRDEGYYDR